jgi:hypothetical protein
MRDGEPQIYTALATLRNGQTQLQWNRVQMFLVFNTIAIPLVMGTGQSAGVKFALSFIGLIGHFAIFVAAVRGDGWIDHWDGKMAELERLDQEEGNVLGSRVRIFDNMDFETRRRRGVTSRRIFGPIGIAFMLFWLGQSVFHGTLFYHS